MYCIQHCFICHPSDYMVSEDAGTSVLGLFSRKLGL
jgi:hypothetical protein